MHIGSPDPDYFRVSGVKPTSSRWKEDWEELELLVSYLWYLFRNTYRLCAGERSFWVSRQSS